MSASSPLIALLALAAVVGLILLTRKAALLLPRAVDPAGRGMGGKMRGPLRLEQALALDPRRRLLLVRCEGQRVLLLTGGPQDVVVGWLAPIAPADTGSPQ